MAENQMEKDDVIVAQSYLENKGLSRLPKDYSEEELQKKFATTMESLKEELDEYEEYRRELDVIGKEENEDKRGFSDEQLSREYIYLNRSRQPVQKEYDSVKKYADYLHEYGDEFAQLYRIKDNNEKYGNPEEIQFVEVDITDNGDMLTQDQYFKMRADRDERVKQLALHVSDKEAEVEYNIGMMEYNQPNMPPQIKMQLSFDEETQNNLDDEKLKSVFAFCEAHGLSISDMEIRNFDGTLAESAIREKIEQALTEAKAAKEAEIAEANAKEYAAQKKREKELEAELQNISLTTDGKLPEGVSKEDISYDLPEEDFVSSAVPESLYQDYDSETAVAENAPENIGKIQRLARGVATAAVPDSDVPDNLDAHAAEENNNVNAAQSVSVPVPAQNAAAPAPKKISKKKAVALFEKLLHEGWSKEKNLSYWKTSTGFFGGGWTEFIIYDSEDDDNRKKDGVKTKDGGVKYTYALKLFIDVDDKGVLHFAYRTPNHKKIDESYLGDIVGQLKDLGYTAITFPPGMPKNDEKGMWRKAMGEKGIVPIGMGLDKSKAEGMLKAAKEKLSAEDYANYQYRLAKQMNKYNHEKGKTVSESEQTFIDGLINTYRYSAFTDAYSKVFKSKVKGILRSQDPYEGAVKKIAAYRALLKTFEVYKSALERGGGDIMNAVGIRGLSDAEKAQLRALGSPIHKFNNQQMERVFDILYQHDLDTKHTEFYLRDQMIEKSYGDASVYGPRAAPHIALREACNTAIGNCDSINDDLTALGVEKIELIKIGNVRLEFKKFNDVYLPEYRRTHPKQNSATQAAEESEYSGEESRSQTVKTGTASGKAAAEKTAPAKSDKPVVRNIAPNKGNVYN